MKLLRSTSASMVRGYQEYLTLEHRLLNGRLVYAVMKRRRDDPSWSDVIWSGVNYGLAKREWDRLSDRCLVICS